MFCRFNERKRVSITKVMFELIMTLKVLGIGLNVTIIVNIQHHMVSRRKSDITYDVISVSLTGGPYSLTTEQRDIMLITDLQNQNLHHIPGSYHRFSTICDHMDHIDVKVVIYHILCRFMDKNDSKCY